MFLQNRMVCVFFPEVYTSVGWDIVNNCWFWFFKYFRIRELPLLTFEKPLVLVIAKPQGPMKYYESNWQFYMQV
jgi:hypothetical protein